MEQLQKKVLSSILSRLEKPSELTDRSFQTLAPSLPCQSREEAKRAHEVSRVGTSALREREEELSRNPEVPSATEEGAVKERVIPCASDNGAEVSVLAKTEQIAEAAKDVREKEAGGDAPIAQSPPAALKWDEVDHRDPIPDILKERVGILAAAITQKNLQLLSSY